MSTTFKEIILHQSKLMERFRIIEENNGFKFPRAPVDIDSYEGQHELRRLAWCIQEELCEAADVALDPEGEDPRKGIHVELIDALHFIAELMLTLGYWPDDLPPEPTGDQADREEPIPYKNLMRTIVALGVTINLLKNRPWKQTCQKVNEVAFKKSLAFFIRSYARTCYAYGMTDDSIVDAYYGKASVNEGRISTGA